MKKLIAALALVGASLSLHAAITPGHPAYEPFADATASGGTSYAPGSLLIGQTNAQGLSWAGAGTSNNFQPKLVTGNLSVTGLAPSQGNDIAFGFASASTGETGRLGLGGAMANGTVYYSLIINVTGGLNSGQTGAVIAGFNNSTGSQSGQPTVIDGRLDIRTNIGGVNQFNLGLDKSGATGGIVWDTTDVFTTNQTLFVVVSYTFVSGGASNDLAQLWINPDPSTFGTANPPSPTLITTNGNDATQIASFLARQGSSLEPNLAADELRVGVTWADVTPPPSETAAISNVAASQSVSAGTTNAILSGTVGATSPLTLFPSVGEQVIATINGVSGTNTVTDNSGDFSGTFNASSIPAGGPYTITYSYGGNGFLSAATDSSTTLTITPAATQFSITSESLDSTGANLVMSWQATPGTTYQVVGTTNLTPPINWTNVGSAILASGTNVTATNAIVPPVSYYSILVSH